MAENSAHEELPHSAARVTDKSPVERVSEAGFTIAEVATAILLFSAVITGGMMLMNNMSSAFQETQVQSNLLQRARYAFDRLDSHISRAVSTDAQFALSLPSGDEFGALTFREVSAVNAGAVVYDDQLLIHILGPGRYSQTIAGLGLVIGRGPDVATIYELGAGADGFLGTTDDDTRASVNGGVPAVELLIPSEMSPATGEMLAIEMAASGRRLTVTLRLNAQDRQGQFVFDNDLVLTQEIALRQ